MNTLHFTIDINASKQHVWDVMLGDETYRQWTTPFSPGSYFEGMPEKMKDMFAGMWPDALTKLKEIAEQ